MEQLREIPPPVWRYSKCKGASLAAAGEQSRTFATSSGDLFAVTPGKIHDGVLFASIAALDETTAAISYVVGGA
jgi:hypothetical protein